MVIRETGTIDPLYESPEVRVLALKVKGAILNDSMNASMDSFEVAWDENFWDE